MASILTTIESPLTKATVMSAATANPMSVLSKVAPTDSDRVETLPRLTTSEFQIYNRLAVTMDAYHSRFRRTWTMLHQAASTGRYPAGISLRGFVNSGVQLCQHITMHHQFEEQYIYPKLAERMPVFRDNEFLIKEHDQIHEGLEKTQKYLQECQSRKRELRMNEMKDIMDSYGTVLWENLDNEVKMLGAEHMRKYWTEAEMMTMRWG